MSEDNELSIAEEQALLLAQAAIALGDEIAKDARSLHTLAELLDRNVQIWLAMKSIVSLEGCSLSAAVRENIGRLADYVVSRTALGVENISEQTIKSFININLQISEGLLEGVGKS
jgi:Flagellar protein FlaF.